MTKGVYTQQGRLADVLALIQVLALDKAPHRTEQGILREIQAPPNSATGWFALAMEHPEFFRVNPELPHGLSLVARHVLPHDKDGSHPALPTDFTATLLQTAINLHDRQVQAAEQWKAWVPVWSALGAALLASLTTLFTLWLNGWCKP